MRVIAATFDRRRGIAQRLGARSREGRRIAAFATRRPWIESEIISHEHWEEGPVRLDVITNEPAGERDRDLLVRSDKAALAWTGSIRGDPSPWPDASEVSRLGGCFAIVQADSERLIGWTSVHRMEPLYVAEGQDVIVLSTSARIAHAVSNQRPEAPPEQALLGLSGPGYMISDETPFPGVRAVPADNQIVVDSRGVTVSRLPRPAIDDQTPLPEVVEAVCQELLAAAEFHARRGEASLCQVTGGKDSRLVLAALAHVGANTTAITNGFPEHPDVLVGRRVAEALAVPHEVETPVVKSDSRSASMQVDPRSQAFRTLTAAESMLTAYEVLDPEGDKYRRDTIMGGHGGELLRGGFGYRLKRMDGALALRRLDLVALPHAKLLAERGLALADTLLASWRERIQDSPERALADFYLIYRSGRWRSVSHSAESIRHPNLSLLADNQVVRLGMATSQQRTWNEQLFFMVMERIAPGLAKIPFFRSRWNFEHEGPTDLFDPSSWKARKPVDVHHGRGAFNWRIDYSNEIHRHFTEVLLERSPLHDIINRSLLVRFMDQTSDTRTGFQAKTVWSMYTAQQLLLGLAASDSPPEPLLFEVEVPAKPRSR